MKWILLQPKILEIVLKFPYRSTEPELKLVYIQKLSGNKFLIIKAKYDVIELYYMEGSTPDHLA